jgi:hypothetical protein
MNGKQNVIGILKAIGLCLTGAAVALGIEHREEISNRAKPIIKNLNKKVQKLPPLFKGQNIFSTLRGK